MKRKLNSERGVALAFVIAAFAVVMVLGTVGITAGYANYTKTFGRAESRQAYLTLISEARLLREELDGAQIVVNETSTVTDGAEYPEEPERSISYLPETGLASQMLLQLAEGSADIHAVIHVEKAGYSQDIRLNMKDVRLDHEAAELHGSKRDAALQMTCSGRTVLIDAFFTPDYLPVTERVKDEGVVVCTAQTVYTLTIGAIHEEAS